MSFNYLNYYSKKDTEWLLHNYNVFKLLLDMYGEDYNTKIYVKYSFIAQALANREQYELIN